MRLCAKKLWFVRSKFPNSLKKLNSFRFLGSVHVLEPDEWCVDYNNVIMKEVIGSGAFGNVHKATVTGLPCYPPQKEVIVAVKTLRSKSDILKK